MMEWYRPLQTRSVVTMFGREARAFRAKCRVECKLPMPLLLPPASLNLRPPLPPIHPHRLNLAEKLKAPWRRGKRPDPALAAAREATRLEHEQGGGALGFTVKMMLIGLTGAWGGRGGGCGGMGEAQRPTGGRRASDVAMRDRCDALLFAFAFHILTSRRGE